VLVHVDAARHGVSAHELLQLGGNIGRLGDRELDAWLLDAGLAERNGAPDLLVRGSSCLVRNARSRIRRPLIMSRPSIGSSRRSIDCRCSGSTGQAPACPASI
jgi:hypothetical protein